VSPASKGAKTDVDVDGRTLSLSNLDKVMYPATGFTKGQVIDYYARIGPTLLPHLAGRPVTLKRYPNGVDGQSFYEKNCPKHRPEWMRTAPVWTEVTKRTIEYCLIDEVAALVWTANMAAIELHPSLARAEDLQRPTSVVFDLDPGPPADVLTCCRVALLVREVLDQLGLVSFVKTSGSKGMQLYVPLNSDVTYEDTRPFSQAMAQLLTNRNPDLVVSEQKRELRPGKVLVDWSQNTDFKTTVSVYALRARERPTVSTPVAWEEVEAALRAEDAELLRFETADVLERVTDKGDLFADLLTTEQALPKLG
jgi:bifunctional non-homologous end joining protein LigD